MKSSSLSLEMPSLILRNLIFTILQPGLVAGVVPVMILTRSGESVVLQALSPIGGLAIVLFIAGLAIMLYCIASFTMYGRGTLSPADPTKELVMRGLYRYSRNPMYVGVVAMLAGEALYFSSWYLGGYAALVFGGFDLYIRFFEEPRLRKDFGEAYEAYCLKVRRWI